LSTCISIWQWKGQIVNDLAHMGARRTTLSERALAAIRAAIDRKALTQTQLAKMTSRFSSNMSEIIAGKRPLPFDVIEAAAELLQVDPAELMADPQNLVKVLNPLEAELLRYIRAWPKSTREAFLTFLRFFADESRANQQIRQAVEYLRTLDKPVRDRAVAYLLMLSEGGLSRDVRIALGLPEVDATPPRRQWPGKPRRALSESSTPESDDER
jgi:transcriptional regulator with XRE-family HTH domain